ncbi:glutamine synthetase family protein [Rhizobium sp. C1]|uniref:glutamine synthetase family protein n=1 Tax=Rhizobium sp. C1 TaxID=1349799 RepID=UPI001E616727|nr:glutamine synthetase family protein [Rhizobium sp. C1]MCD2176937.1 glutamine synthetase family protein [Rhizobium sp. C1]
MSQSDLKPHTAEPAHLYAAITDMNGIFRGKRVAAEKLGKLQKDGIRMPMSSIGVDIWGTDTAGTQLTMERGDLDGICEVTGRGLIDLGMDAPVLPMSMRKESGEPYYADSRHLLQLVLERYRAAGLTPVVASEVEFYLIDPASDGVAPARPNTGGPPPSFDNIYSLEELSDTGAFIDDLCRCAAAAGIEVEAAIAEGAQRQFEFNLMHQPDALKAAEDTLFLKQIIRNVARRHGTLATFMAKPYPDKAGSGLHIHFSILDESGRNVFDDGTEKGSEIMRAAVAGLMDSMADATLIFAPHLNSYRRLSPGGLAPTTVGWGYENRTAAIRIPGGPHVARRIEHRVAGIDTNPFLVLATILGGALDGIARMLTPAEPVASNSHELDLQKLAKDWRQALERFETAESMKRILHPEFVTCFAAAKQQEQDVFAAQVTDLEIATYRLSV